MVSLPSVMVSKTPSEPDQGTMVVLVAAAGRAASSATTAMAIAIVLRGAMFISLTIAEKGGAAPWQAGLRLPASAAIRRLDVAVLGRCGRWTCDQPKYAAGATRSASCIKGRSEPSPCSQRAVYAMA